MEKTRKTLNLIALAVFLSSNFLTPLSYAVDDLGVIRDETPMDSSAEPQNDDSTSSRAEGNEGEGSSKTPMDSSAEPENDDSTSSRAEGNEGEGSSNNSKTPMDSHVADAPQNDNEQPDGQEGTTENLAIEELKELIENEENNSEIVETEGIYGTGKYEGVKVEVYAQTGAFPLGTILNIIPITGDDEMSDIQDVLEQQKNVEKSQKVIAFDITFLDPETEEELQPLMTGAVQVTFNYEENDEFVAAEENEEQEVKVYHLNDKDDEGEKIESITGTIVEDAVVNEEASDEVDNAVVIDAESFSYYTIVVQIREEAPESDPTQTWQYGEDYFTINIARPSGFSSTDYPIEGFTIMDRNLGASISGTTCNTTNAKGACGYLYQWGNNYGFPISANASSILTGVGLTWDNSYNNNGYVSKKFVNGNSLNYDVWSDSSHHDGVWGGANDVNFSSSKNSTTKLYWDDGGDRTLRQGPCPEGWHVPSAGEWSMLLDYWYYTNYKAHPSISQNLYYFSDSTTDSTKRQAFMDYFYIPLAGNRNYSNASLDSQGSYGSYWSSSPFSASSRSARDLYLVSISVNVSYNDYRAYGFSVRCFKDSYVASPESSNLVDTQAWVEGEDFETITISNPDNINEGFTIMDRNLGATATGYGASASADSYGFKYQWGNNYGFRDSDRVTAVTAGLTYNSIYDNHGYYSTNFINGSSHDYDVWDGTNPTANGKEHHDGLWGGANDSSSNNRGANQTNPTDRQGPCPVGYHVPSAGEWGLLIKYWADTKDNGTTKNATYGGSSGLYYLNSNYSAFQQRFNLPFAGNRNYSSASLGDQGFNGYYWSSSPYSAGSSSARILRLNSSNVNANSNNRRAYGFSVRCFKDSYVAPKVITYNPNGGAFSGMSVNEATVVTYTKNASGTYVPDINIQFPNREGYMFDGWYTTATNQTTERRLVMEESTAITDVYAKWLEFEPYDVKDDNGNTLFTIMDRNLGATTTGTTCSSSNLPACGKLFQWGNNYGFDNSTSPWPYRTGSASVPYTDLVDASEYGPGNYYSSSTFILRPDGSDYYRWDKTDNANLWGGAGDTDTSRGPGTDADRQGPCPVNYHVPSTLEWKSAYNLLGLTSSAEGVTKLQTKLWLPFAGYRYRGNSNVYYQGSYGYYWSSTRYNENNAYYLYFNSSNIYPQRYTNRSYAFSVRCFKDSPTQTLTFVREGAGTVDSKQVYWYEPIQLSYKPSAPSGTTETWYTDAELTSPFTFGSTTYVTQAKTLYSDVTCSDASSIWDGTECIQQFTVTLDATTNAINGGTPSQASVIVNDGSAFSISSYGATPGDNTYTFRGWSENPNSDVILESDPTITSDTTFYAVYSKTLAGTFNYNATVSSISTDSATCTLRNKNSNCTLSAPSITCAAGYDNGKWTPQSMTISENETFTASCSDAQKPVCSISTQPTNTLISTQAGFDQGTVTFTCTDNVGVTTDNISASNITYDSDVVTLSNFTAGGTSTSKTFTFTYTAKSVGSTTFSLNAGAVLDAEGNSNDATVSSNSVTVDTTTPSVSADKSSNDWYAGNVNITLSVSDTNGLNYAKYSWVSAADCLSNGTDFTDGTEITQTLEGENTLYLCVQDNAGNTNTWNGTYKLDKTAPTCKIEGNPSTPTNQNVNLNVLYLVEANQIADGYSWDGENYSTAQGFTVTQNGTYTAYVKDAAGNIGSCSETVTMIDKVLPEITINNPDTTPAKSKTITATTDKGTLYMAITGVNVCNDSLNFVAYDSITFNLESDNGKYVCYKAVDNAGNEKYEISAQIEGIDTTAPVCNITTQPTRTSMSLVNGYNQGTVTFTCTDNVGVSTTNLSASNINYDSNVVTLSNSTAGGTSTSKTFTFTYTANAQGSTTFALKAGAVSDAAGNSNVVTDASNTVTVDTTAPTITITQENAGTWTQSKSVTASASDGTLTMKESTSSTCNSSVENFVTYVDKNYTSESDNGKYICYKAVDSVGNEAYESSAKVEKIDTTAPTLVSKNSFGDTWYTQNPISTFTYTDGDGSGISGLNTRTCEITQEGSASTCQITNVEICDIAGNCNTDDQTSNPAKLDRTQPVCGTWTYQPISQTNTDVTATLVDSTDATSGIKKAGGTCTLTSNEDTCDVTIEDNAGLTRVCTSQSVNNIDKVKPEGTIQVVTSTPKSTTQEVKLICSDNVGVSSYYWGTNSNPAIADYKSITNVQTNYEVTETVDAAGTYYLLCKDEAGNVSDSKSQVYNSYEVHNMLNAVDKEESTYNSTNYPQDGNTATYIAPAGTILAAVDVYTVPGYSAANMYKGYTTAVSGTPDTSASVTLNSNSTYYFWFDRTKYDLNLIKNAGIETIYYKVNGMTNYSNTGVTTSVPMKAGSNAYAYAVASSGYTLTGDFVNYDENTPWEKDDVLANQEFAPNTTMNEYIVTWKDYDGRELSGTVYHYNDDLVVPSNPSRAEDDSYTYTFKGWNPELVEKVTEDAVYTAEYEATPRGSRSSGGGRRSKETPSPIDVINETVNENVHHAADEKEDIESKTETRNETKSEDSTQSSDTSDTKTAESKYTQEFVEAYEFAKNNGVTTMQTIDKAKMNTEMTRIEMAKMLSNYAINVLGKKPDTTKKVLFDDVSSKLDKQYDDAVTKAYQLGIMGQNMSKNRFRPQDKVSRAEFATALSRMIYNTTDGEYAGTRKYYTSHMAKLYNEGIINKTDPSIKEKRGYVMIMLMRTVK